MAQVVATAGPRLSAKQEELVAAAGRHGWAVESTTVNKWTDGTCLVVRNGADTERLMLSAYWPKSGRVRHGAMRRSYYGDFESTTIRSLFFTMATSRDAERAARAEQAGK